jgi:hypothetical protein
MATKKRRKAYWKPERVPTPQGARSWSPRADPDRPVRVQDDPGEIALARFMAHATGEPVKLIDFYAPGSGQVHTAHTPEDDEVFYGESVDGTNAGRTWVVKR